MAPIIFNDIEISKVLKYLLIGIYGICVPILVITIFLLPITIIGNEIDDGHVLKEVYSKDQEYCIKATEENIVSLFTYSKLKIELERVYFNKIKRSVRTLYDGKNPRNVSIRWIDHTTISINGNHIKIDTRSY